MPATTTEGTNGNGKLRVAAIGDLHVMENSVAPYRELFTEISSHADVLLLCGDLTNFGKTSEAEILAEDIKSCAIPVLGVLGNHDYECGQPEVVCEILHAAGMVVLDEQAHEIDGVGFAGVKGFAGGFGRGALGPWGEVAIKQFVQAAVDEALKLEAALARLRTPLRVAVLHYSPIRGTVEGEPVEIFPYLGSSRLEEPINRYRVSAVFHGHAHRGTAEGRTATGVPVYNVAMPLLARLNPDRPPFLVLELPLEGGAHPSHPAGQIGDPLVRTA